METNWAEENLKAIRTLMERSALYRRALAPVMTFAGALGLAAAVLGWMLHVASPRAFVLYWLSVAVLALVGALLLVRRQALKDSEPFWSPPMRRVAQMSMPPFFAGFALAVAGPMQLPDAAGRPELLSWTIIAWIVLYGCGLHAAGMFMPRGIRFFGLIFVFGGCGLFAFGVPAWLARLPDPNGVVMGGVFGVLQLAYGIYLYFTEKREPSP